MSHFFGESVRKARREHFCDFCFAYIQPGEIYRRVLWVARRDHFHVMKEHYTPGCPPGVDREIAEEIEAERVALGVPMVFVAEIRHVLKVGRNGETIVEPETYFTTKVAEALPVTMSYTDDDIPF